MTSTVQARLAGRIGGNIWLIFWNGGISQISHDQISTKYRPNIDKTPLGRTDFSGGLGNIWSIFWEGIQGDIWARPQKRETTWQILAWHYPPYLLPHVYWECTREAPIVLLAHISDLPRWHCKLPAHEYLLLWGTILSHTAPREIILPTPQTVIFLVVQEQCHHHQQQIMTQTVSWMKKAFICIQPTGFSSFRMWGKKWGRMRRRCAWSSQRRGGPGRLRMWIGFILSCILLRMKYSTACWCTASFSPILQRIRQAISTALGNWLPIGDAFNHVLTYTAFQQRMMGFDLQINLSMSIKLHCTSSPKGMFYYFANNNIANSDDGVVDLLPEQSTTIQRSMVIKVVLMVNFCLGCW